MDLRRDAHSLRIGPSRLDWHGNELTVEINEVTVPVPSRVIGTVHLRPQALVPHTFALDTESHHYWHPVAPCGRIEVTMQRPHLRWSGNAYFDCNFGDEPLEAAFKEWDWTRARIGTNTAVIYDITPRRSPLISLSLLFDPQGGIEAFAAPPRTALPGTFWRMRRSARSANDAPHLIKTLEDTPFYARSLISASILGTQTIGIHESLSLGRVANPIVRAMLPFRMPRHRWRHN
jgi:carotenoid 1,2-hydratase